MKTIEISGLHSMEGIRILLVDDEPHIFQFSISGFVEVLLRGAANRPEQLYNALNSMQGESKRIIKLVEDLAVESEIGKGTLFQVSLPI